MKPSDGEDAAPDDEARELAHELTRARIRLIDANTASIERGEMASAASSMQPIVIQTQPAGTVHLPSDDELERVVAQAESITDDAEVEVDELPSRTHDVSDMVSQVGKEVEYEPLREREGAPFGPEPPIPHVEDDGKDMDLDPHEPIAGVKTVYDADENGVVAPRLEIAHPETEEDHFMGDDTADEQLADIIGEDGFVEVDEESESDDADEEPDGVSEHHRKDDPDFAAMFLDMSREDEPEEDEDMDAFIASITQDANDYFEQAFNAQYGGITVSDGSVNIEPEQAPVETAQDVLVGMATEETVEKTHPIDDAPGEPEEDALTDEPETCDEPQASDTIDEPASETQDVEYDPEYDDTPPDYDGLDDDEDYDPYADDDGNIGEDDEDF